MHNWHIFLGVFRSVSHNSRKLEQVQFFFFWKGPQTIPSSKKAYMIRKYQGEHLWEWLRADIYFLLRFLIWNVYILKLKSLLLKENVEVVYEDTNETFYITYRMYATWPFFIFMKVNNNSFSLMGDINRKGNSWHITTQTLFYIYILEYIFFYIKNRIIKTN